MLGAIAAREGVQVFLEIREVYANDPDRSTNDNAA